MLTYIFIGRVLPEAVRISSFTLTTRIEAGEDRPDGEVKVEVVNNYVIGQLTVNREINQVEIATVANVVQGIAAEICNSGSLALGTWTVALVTVCIQPNGLPIVRFDEAKSPGFEAACAAQGINWDRIFAINRHPEGNQFRLAIDDVIAGLYDQKFMRTKFYRAVESLRQSVGKGTADKKKQWEKFWHELGVSREEFAILKNHDERHANYGALQEPIRAAQVQDIEKFMVKLLARYMQWFERTYLAAG